MSTLAHAVVSSHLPARAKQWLRSDVVPFVLLALFAVVLDQRLALVLYSSSPRWAILIFVLLVMRRGLGEKDQSTKFSFPALYRLAAFCAANALLVLIALRVAPLLVHGTPGMSAAGWTLASAKVLVLAPLTVLFPLSQWVRLLRVYGAEAVAAVVVLFTFFPIRMAIAAWPWYGQILGHTVYLVARVFVPSIHYVPGFYPTLTGPDLDVQILMACSGINGIELFDCLFGFVVLFDWNRMNKLRTLLAYLLGIAAILLGNALRIASFVVAGNHGLADIVTRFHLPAGSIFFAIVFLIYLAVAYPWMLRPSKTKCDYTRGFGGKPITAA